MKATGLSHDRPDRTSNKLSNIRLTISEGGPGFCQFAINNVCNARCGFCNFAVNKLPQADWQYATRQGALDAVDILFRNGIRYLVITGGEPMLHPDLNAVVAHANSLGMVVLLVTNGGLLKRHRIEELAASGLSSFIISIDAATVQAHEENRGLPGVCNKIREANKLILELGLHSTASVTMSRLVDYDALPDFLNSLGFKAVTFSYPLGSLQSNFLGFSGSDLVNYTREELLEAFSRVKQLKKRMMVVNPGAGIEEMQRFLQDEEQRFPCLGGFQYFYLDWNLKLWRCHNWDTPMCSIYEFDGSQRIRDDCTRCMIDCYRDASVMQHIGVSVHDSFRALRQAKPGRALAALTRKGNLESVKAVFEQLPWLIRF